MLDSNNYTPKKYTKFTIYEIEQYLSNIKKLIGERKYTISVTDKRKENKEFIYQYNINSKKEMEMLKRIEYPDFCYAVDNKKEEYKDEKLYIFCRCFGLDCWGEKEEVEVYFKFNVAQIKGRFL